MKQARIKLQGVCIGIMLCLSGCGIYKTYERPEVNVAGLYRDPYAVADTLRADTFNMGKVNWRDLFRDEKLQVLIEKGLANNVDLQIARLRVEEAQASLLASRLAFLPSLSLAPEGTISSYNRSKAVKTYQLPLVTSWEADLSGRLLNASRGPMLLYFRVKPTGR